MSCVALVMMVSSGLTQHSIPQPEMLAQPISFRITSHEVRRGQILAQCRLKNRSDVSIKVYPPVAGASITWEWTLPSGLRIAPASVIVNPSFAGYEERVLLRGSSLVGSDSVVAPETVPAGASYRALLTAVYSSKTAHFHHVDLEWKGTPPIAIAVTAQPLVVDVKGGRIGRVVNLGKPAFR